MSDNITADSLAGAELNVPAADGSAAVSDVVSFKDLVNKELGKDFKDDETAMKAVKDTFSYVGEYGKARPVLKELQDKFGDTFISKMEQLNNTNGQPVVDTSKFVTKDELDKVTFYAEHKDLEPHKALIEALSVTTGKARGEVSEMPELKGVLDKAKAHDEAEKSKSVLQSNPRLGVAADNMTKSQEAFKAGDQMGAEKAAMAAVMEAYPQ